MSRIRDFCNADLPSLARVWSDHWSLADSPPPVSTTIIERALLSRSFFLASDLLVAVIDGSVEGWCQIHRPDEETNDGHSHDETITLSAICFTQAGLDCCDELLSAAEDRARELGKQAIVAGPLRDQSCGYVGLPPIGHGIGVPEIDVRVASLLTRHGYSPDGSFNRMVVSTAPYRPPVSREMMQFRRSTRTESVSVLPDSTRTASAMSHLDIEHHRLVNHRSGDRLADVRLWLSDPDSQVMSCSEAILDLSPIQAHASLAPAETFLVAAVIQTLATRCVFQVETSINSDEPNLINQLENLGFQCTQRGRRWRKSLT